MNVLRATIVGFLKWIFANEEYIERMRFIEQTSLVTSARSSQYLLSVVLLITAVK